MVNKQKTYQTDFIFDDIGWFSKGSPLPVSKNKKVGFVDEYGVEVIPFMYDVDGTNGLVSDFNSGICVVKKGQYFGIIDNEGKIIRPFEYEIAISESRFDNTILLRKNRVWELIDLQKIE